MADEGGIIGGARADSWKLTNESALLHDIKVICRRIERRHGRVSAVDAAKLAALRANLTAVRTGQFMERNAIEVPNSENREHD
jgi:hypothetical protein